MYVVLELIITDVPLKLRSLRKLEVTELQFKPNSNLFILSHNRERKTTALHYQKFDFHLLLSTLSPLVALFDIDGDSIVQGDRETVDLVGSVRTPSLNVTADDIADALILGAFGLDNELIPISLS